MQTPQQKGNALEAAVHAIESVILETSPSLNEKTFSIESKKIIVVAGVRHEIDLHVTVDLGSGYSSIFIFECKNWEDAVGKNEIIVFTEKIAVCRAQHGYFVAKSFTADARAQAAKDNRMVLLEAAQHPFDLPSLDDFHCTVQEGAPVLDLTLRTRGAGPDAILNTVDSETASVMWRGQQTPLKGFLHAWQKELAAQALGTFDSADLPEGVYQLSAERTHTFSDGEFVLQDKDVKDIEQAHVALRLGTRIVRPAVVSHFEVKTRGRVVTYAPVPTLAGPIIISLVSTNSNPQSAAS
jgi:hypothetical protein